MYCPLGHGMQLLLSRGALHSSASLNPGKQRQGKNQHETVFTPDCELVHTLPGKHLLQQIPFSLRYSTSRHISVSDWCNNVKVALNMHCNIKF